MANNTIPMQITFTEGIAALLRFDRKQAKSLAVTAEELLARQMYTFCSDWLEKFAHIIWDGSHNNDAIVSAWADHFESENAFLRNAELDERASMVIYVS